MNPVLKESWIERNPVFSGTLSQPPGFFFYLSTHITVNMPPAEALRSLAASLQADFPLFLNTEFFFLDYCLNST